MALTRKICHRLEFKIILRDLTGIEEKKCFRKEHKDTKKGTLEDKVDGNLDQWEQCDNYKNGRSYTRLPIFLPFQLNSFFRLNIDSNHNSCDVSQEEEN